MAASTQQEKHKGNPNPSPETRFGAGRANPQSPGGWKKENTLSYQYRRFLSMTAAEFEAFAKTPKDSMTMAEYGAYSQVLQLRKSLPHAKEIADRVEGKPYQQVDVTSDGEKLEGLVIIRSDEQA